MTKKQAPKSADARWLRRCDAAFQCARLHGYSELLSALSSSDFKMSWISTHSASVSTPCVAESQPGSLFFVRFPTHSQDEGSTSDQVE